MTQENEIQNKYIEYQSVVEHLNKMQQQINLINQQMAELAALSSSLDDLSNAKLGTKSYSQIGSGVFVLSEIKETKNVLINVGADVAVVKTIDEAKESIEKQLSDLREIVNNINSDLEKFSLYQQSLQGQLQEMIEKEKGKSKSI